MSMNKNSVCREVQEIKNYTMIPNSIWDLDISGKARIVWIYLQSNAPQFDPSSRMIAKKTDLCRLSVQNALSELSAGGLIDIIPAKKRGVRTRYRMRGPADWIASPKKRPNDLPEEVQSYASDGLKFGQERPTIVATDGKAMGRNNMKTTSTTTRTKYEAHKASCSSAEFSVEERAKVFGNPKSKPLAGSQEDCMEISILDMELNRPHQWSDDFEIERIMQSLIDD